MKGLAAWKKKRERVLFILCGAAGLRISEALGLEIDKHVSEDCQTLFVRQKARGSKIENRLKTHYSERAVDLHPSIAALLKEYIGDRKSSLLFCTRDGKPLPQSNIVRHHLHKALKQLQHRNAQGGQPHLPQIQKHIPAEPHRLSGGSHQVLDGACSRGHVGPI